MAAPNLAQARSKARKKGSRISVSDLAHVGPGTPAGEWLRCYWLVVGTTEELRDIPVGVKILGEELVLFRDLNGRIGLVGLHCPHRGSSLEYGEIEARGIRCPYHAWLFDVAGNCVEQPAEPKDSQFHKKVRHLSYPVQQRGGLVFAYLGPERTIHHRCPTIPLSSAVAAKGTSSRSDTTIITGSTSSKTASIPCTSRCFIAATT